jgi:hypothetical protein
VYGLDRYRFYAASLLFIYDGDATVQSAYEQSLGSSPGSVPMGKGATRGSNEEDSSSWTTPSQTPASTTSPRLLRSPTSPSTPTTKRSKVAGAVTIRLIDFAHCTTGDDFLPPLSESDYGFPSPSDHRPRASFPPTHPNQPDLGFLLGLKSLCAALRMIWDEETKGGVSLKIDGEGVFEEIFGMGALSQRLGEGVGPEDVWDLRELSTA